MPVDPTTTVGIIAALVAFIGMLGKLHLADVADVRKQRDDAMVRADKSLDISRDQVAATNRLADEFERLRTDPKPRSR